MVVITLFWKIGPLLERVTDYERWAISYEGTARRWEAFCTGEWL